MAKLFLTLFIMAFIFWMVTGLAKFTHWNQIDSKDNGDPLFLTPLIKSGKFEEARSKAKVIGLPNAPEVESYSGYLTVNETINSNMFFWFFPSKDSKSPLTLWLQGGPGASSMFGLFVEHGPFQLINNESAVLRDYSWVEIMSLLYFDNPVGTGFSFTEHEKGYATTEDDVARDLYSALQQFYTLFSEYRDRDFYLTGESYAGKYVPAFGYLLHTKHLEFGIKFKGIAIGNGFVDPEKMMDHSSYFYQVSLFDQKQAEIGRMYEQKMLDDIKNGRFLECIQKRDEYLSLPTSFFVNTTGITFHYNILLTDEPYDQKFFPNYLDKSQTRKAIHVGDKAFNDGKTVLKYLQGDRCKSAKQWLEVLMDNYKVLLYSGQLDIIDPSPLTDNMIKNCNWRGIDKYAEQKRTIWKLDGKVAGYLKKYDQFYFMVIRDGGHMLPYDQPKAAFEMMKQFINDQL